MFDFLKKKPEVDEFNIICPKCMIRMDKEVKSDIIIDVCKQCGGTWFDKGEIEKLNMHLQNQEQKVMQLETAIKEEVKKPAIKQAKTKPVKQTKIVKKKVNKN